MNFPTAVKSGFRNYATFSGRATRSEYWYWTLFAFLLQAMSSGFGDALSTLISVGLLLPSVAVSVRRMHDTDHRGWWMIVPIANFVFSVKQSDPDMNRFGPPAPPTL